MNRSRRFVFVSLVLAGLSIAAVTATVWVRVAALLGSVLIAGWIGVLEARRRMAANTTLSKDQEAAGVRMDPLPSERLARDEADDASQFKDDFLATVSHELRTPLNAIVGWTHVLKRGMLTGRDRERALDAVDRNAAAMTRLVNDLLDVSRLWQGRLQLSVGPLDLRDIARSAEDTLAPAAAAKNLTVTMRLDVDDVPVTGDEARLQQLAWHLISNAVKFTPAGGSITVEVWRFGGRAHMRVSDSGEGIAAEMLPHVFEPFRRTRDIGRTGLGVGLAIVQHLVELHGGTIEARSPGRARGAIFTLTLPLVKRPTQHSARPRSASRPTHGSLKTVS